MSMKVIKTIFSLPLPAFTGMVLILALNACTSETSAPPPKPSSAAKSETSAKPDTTVKVGEASWYGPGFEDKKTASGDHFDSNSLTAASPTLPLGSKAVVTNLENGKKTHVTINDRGPYAKGRILDVSKAAAKKLGMTKDGAVKVKVVGKKTARKKKTKKTIASK
jgi:rare lipoprotein A